MKLEIVRPKLKVPFEVPETGVVRPILFSGPLVRDILSGAKRQTRRPLAIQPTLEKVNRFKLVGTETKSGRMLWESHGGNGPVNAFKSGDNSADCYTKTPAVGDRLWVRETWAVSSFYDDVKPSLVSPGAKVAYPASGGCKGLKKRPSIFMPRWACRIELLVTDVRIQRIRQMSYKDWKSDFHVESDVLAKTEPWLRKGASYSEVQLAGRTRQEHARSRWDAIYAKKYPYENNPWVFAITFRVVFTKWN